MDLVNSNLLLKDYCFQAKNYDIIKYNINMAHSIIECALTGRHNMKMTILRAIQPDMEVNLEHLTDIANIDHDEYGLTMYGKETREGELYYVVLDSDAVSTIRSLDGPNTILSTQELFNLGVAWGSFCTGDIDQGIHLILPVRDVESGLMENMVFEDLCDGFIETECKVGTDYLNTIVVWATLNGVDIGRVLMT